MNNSIVLELQVLATSNENDISDLLRKALLVATKLQLNDFKKWINNELHGYKTDEVPNYRKLSCELKAKNPYRGLIPFIIEDEKLNNLVSIVNIEDPIESLKNLMDNKDSLLQVKIPPTAQSVLMNMQKYPPMPVIRTISKNQVAAIIDTVRTKILEWALKLEEEGILGNGIVFSKSEKEKAKNTNTEIHIENFQGILGDISDSDMKLKLTQNIHKNDFESLKNLLKENGISDEDIYELKEAIEKDNKPEKAGDFGDNVNSWFSKMITKASSGSWDIGIGIASNLLTSAITKYYGL